MWSVLRDYGRGVAVLTTLVTAVAVFRRFTTVELCPKALLFSLSGSASRLLSLALLVPFLNELVQIPRFQQELHSQIAL